MQLNGQGHSSGFKRVTLLLPKLLVCQNKKYVTPSQTTQFSPLVQMAGSKCCPWTFLYQSCSLYSGGRHGPWASCFNVSFKSVACLKPGYLQVRRHTKQNTSTSLLSQESNCQQLKQYSLSIRLTTGVLTLQSLNIFFKEKLPVCYYQYALFQSELLLIFGC